MRQRQRQLRRTNQPASLQEAIAKAVQVKKDFEDANQAYNEKNYNLAIKLFNSYLKPAIKLYQHTLKQRKPLPFLVQSKQTLSQEIPHAYYKLGRCYTILSRTNLAISSYKMVLTYQPNNLNTYHALAIIYYDKNNFKQAEEALHKFVQLDALKKNSASTPKTLSEIYTLLIHCALLNEHLLKAKTMLNICLYKTIKLDKPLIVDIAGLFYQQNSHEVTEKILITQLKDTSICPRTDDIYLLIVRGIEKKRFTNKLIGALKERSQLKAYNSFVDVALGIWQQQAKDDQSAMTYFEKATGKGNMVAACRLANRLYYVKTFENKPRALELFEQAATASVPEAQFHWACILNKDSTCKKPKSFIADLFQQAANEGILPAYCHLAEFYMDGIGVIKSINKGIELFNKAADHKFVPALMILADIYKHDGIVGKANYHKVNEYLERAEKLGGQRAKFLRASLYQYNLLKLSPAKRSFNMALSLYKELAEEGYIPACLALATFYYSENSICDKDIMLAEKYFLQAADEDIEHSFPCLLTIYTEQISKCQRPRDAKPVFSKLRQIIEKAACAGHIIAVFIQLSLDSISADNDEQILELISDFKEHLNDLSNSYYHTNKRVVGISRAKKTIPEKKIHSILELSKKNQNRNPINKSTTIHSLGVLYNQAGGSSAACKMLPEIFARIMADLCGNISEFNTRSLVNILDSISRLQIEPTQEHIGEKLNVLYSTLAAAPDSLDLLQKITIIYSSMRIGLSNSSINLALDSIVKTTLAKHANDLDQRSLCNLLFALAVLDNDKKESNACQYNIPLKMLTPLIHQAKKYINSKESLDPRELHQLYQAFYYFKRHRGYSVIEEENITNLKTQYDKVSEYNHSKKEMTKLQHSVTECIKTLYPNAKTEHLINTFPVDIFVPRSEEHEAFIMQVHGPTHFLLSEDGTRPLKRTAKDRFHDKMLPYPVVHVPYNDWDECPKENRRSYLESLIKETLAKYNQRRSTKIKDGEHQHLVWNKNKKIGDDTTTQTPKPKAQQLALVTK